MASDTFRTVAGPGAATLAERGSTFHARVRRVGTVDGAEDVIVATAEEYPDATHVVPAYRVRDEPVAEHADDAGEPGGSAGEPALTVLRRRELLDVVAVVARHYGGTDLGVGGLARAYAGAVGAAIDDAGVVTERPRERLSVTVAYDDSGTVRAILEGSDATFEADYGEQVVFDVAVPVERADDLLDRVASATSGRATIERGDDS